MIGFVVAYLSQPYQGVATPEVRGLIRANIYPHNTPLEPDIHAHGFDSISGVVDHNGELISHFYDIETSLAKQNWLPEGSGYTGYLNTVNAYGQNTSQLLTKAVIDVPPPVRTEVVTYGQWYEQKHQRQWHRVESPKGAVTIFAKLVIPFDNSESQAYVLRPPGHDPPPEHY